MPALLLLSFVAGILTVAAPCVLPLLPVIVGGSIVRTDADTRVAERQWFRPVWGPAMQAPLTSIRLVPVLLLHWTLGSSTSVPMNTTNISW